MKYVADTIIEMDRDIRNGKISLNPYTTSNTSVCDYCSYSPVCKFDKDNCTPRIADSSVKKEDIWEILKTKGAAAETSMFFLPDGSYIAFSCSFVQLGIFVNSFRFVVF